MKEAKASPAHGEEGHDRESCQHCMVDPKRNRSSLVAWIIAAAAVVFALIVYFSRAGSLGSNLAGVGSIALLAILACPLMMGAMMLMMRKGH